MVKNKTTRGFLTTDEGVYPQLKTEAQTVGWTVNDIGFYKNTKTGDTKIAKLFGKDKRILLTHDKKAHTYNLQGGFKGYIVYEQSFKGTPTKEKLNKFIKNCGKILSKFTSTYAENCIVTMKPLEMKYKKNLIPNKK